MKTLFKIIGITIVVLSLTRCGTLNTLSLAGSVAGGDVKLQSYSYDFETNLTSKSTLMSACASVGQEFGYTLENQTPELISWKVAKSNKVQEYFGKTSETSLFATVIWNEDKGKQTVRIGSYIAANYSDATKAKVDTLINSFETKLRTNLENQHHNLKKLE